MERRSTRGRTSSTSTSSTVDSPSPTKTAGGGRHAAGDNVVRSMPMLTSSPVVPPPVAAEEVILVPEPVPAPDVPDIGGEEVVLNRRGMVRTGCFWKIWYSVLLSLFSRIIDSN